MTPHIPEVTAARQVAAQTAELLGEAPSYWQLDPATRAALSQDLQRIRKALDESPASYGKTAQDPYALTLAGPADLLQRRMEMARQGQAPAGDAPSGDEAAPGAAPTRGPRAATETLAGRAGALSDEIDFPGFVASLIHGTFDALVDASIRQMEAYASLVSAVAKDVDRFTSENVTTNQVRDWLVQRHPQEIQLQYPAGQPRLRARAGPDDEALSPSWLEEYDLAGEELTDELLEEQLIPLARRSIGEQRLQMLATMVLLGMNRIVVQDGTISAKVRFRATARDRARVDFAQSHDPAAASQSSWGSRGAFNQASMMVSTVGANVQADAELKAELFGEVTINFASETLPLERFADSAQLLLLQRNARQPAALPPSAPVPAAAGNAPTAPASEQPAQGSG